MKLALIILALASIPLVFFTMYSRTFKGLKIKLGSFFILREFKSEYLKIRSLNDIFLLFLRLCFAVIIVLLIFDPSDVGAPGRSTIFHESDATGQAENNRYNLKLIAPQNPADKYDEDLYFLNAFIKNYKAKSDNISVIYNPTEKMLDNVKKDIIVFPSRRQARNAFLKWIDILEVTSLRVEKSIIKDADINLNAHYPILPVSDKVIKYAETEDGSAVAVSFEINKRRILLFGAGLSSYWGDLGVSGYFIDIIEDFINNASISENTKSVATVQVAKHGEVRSLLSFGLLLHAAAIIFLIELAVYIFRAHLKSLKIIRTGKGTILFLLLFSSSLVAEDFKFIELTGDGQSGNNKQLFFIIKRGLEEKTSVKISPDFYATHSSVSLANGILPDFPYIWIFDNGNIKLTGRLSEALARFVEKGGIIFVDLSKTGGKSAYYTFFKDLGSDISANAGLTRLPADHPLYKSFYLLNTENFSGVDISISTKRTALIISENNLRARIIRRDENAIKTGVNIVLYMLSGNYKSDQIHTRQILNRLKKRELFR